MSTPSRIGPPCDNPLVIRQSQSLEALIVKKRTNWLIDLLFIFSILALLSPFVLAATLWR